MPPEEELELLVELHGWDALGAVVQAVMEEKKIHMLVGCGVPFDEATKIAGLRKVDYEDL